MYLAIDTATSTLGLALLDEEEVAGQLYWRTNQNHTAELIPAIRYLLAKAEKSLHDLQGFIVALGPGGFTGLRVGMTTAKGFAVSTGAPLVGVGTLEASAYPYTGLGAPVCSILGAGRAGVAAATYLGENAILKKVVAEHITTIETLASTVGEPTIFCGGITPEIESELRERLGARALVPPMAAQGPRAIYLAELGRRRIETGDLDNPTTLQPLYLRRPSITKPSRPRAR